MLTINGAFANLHYHPIKFEISTDKESYYEGEKITFTVTITNTDKENTHPVLVPHTQNVGQKLFYLNVYDKANNTMLLRYTEDRMLDMTVQDTGTAQISYLKPLEQIIIPIYLNDVENYHTENASNHKFEVPLFAGIYKINVAYNPNGIALGDSIYNYYSDTQTDLPMNGKLAMTGNGELSNLCLVKIKRSADILVTIEGQKYYIKTDGHRYYYFNEYVDQLTTDQRCVHLTSLLPDSCSSQKSEYFYSQFLDRYNEFVLRFDDGDIQEYRKFTGWCPDYLYTERYNELKQKTGYQRQLPDKRFYSVSYNQPSGTIHQETYCSEYGTTCDVTTYIYSKSGEFVRKEVTQTQPCVEIEVEGKKRGARRVFNLEGE